MENGPHEEAAFPAEEPADDEEELPSAHSPEEELEEVEVDEDEARPQKRPRQGDSAASSPSRHTTALEDDDDTGSSSPSARESNDPQEPLSVDPLDSAPPLEFGRMPSVSVDSDDEELR